MRRTFARLAAAATLAAAAYAVVPSAPASAAGCSSAHGVTVVADFNDLGGGVQSACVAGGGGDTAADLFTAAGFSLTYVQRQPGFVCRVAGKPADNPCVNTPPADAYWALFWSDGTSGSWTYATSGAGGQHVPDGGYVGFSWQSSDTRSAPGYRPAPHPSATPTPTQQSTQHGGHSGSSAGHGAGHASTAASPSPSSTTSASASGSDAPESTPTAATSDGSTSARGAKRSHPPSGSASPSASGQTAPTQSTSPAAAVASDPSDPDGGGLPAWVAPAVVAALLAAAAGVAVVRRRTSP